MTANETITDVAGLQAWIEEARDQGYVALDTETDSLDAMQANLVGVSLALAPGRACYVPLQHASGGTDLFDTPEDGGDDEGISQIPLKDALAALKPLLEDPSILKIGQNLKYDILVLANHGAQIAALDDTMLMSYALDGGKGGHGMDELAKRHLQHDCIPFKEVVGSGKAAVTFDRVPIAKATAYAAEDADVTLRLWQALKPRLVAEGRTGLYETLERPMVPVLAEMERAGVYVERHVLSRLSGDFCPKHGRP